MIQKEITLGGIAMPIAQTPIHQAFDSPYPDQIASQVFAQCKEILSKNKELSAGLFAISHDTQSMFTMPIPEPSSRGAVEAFLKVGVKKLGVSCLVTASEAWMATGVEGMSLEEAQKIVPSEDPNRKEAVIVFVSMSTGEKASRMAIIERNDDGMVSRYLDMDGEDCPYGVESEDLSSWIDGAFSE